MGGIETGGAKVKNIFVESNQKQKDCVILFAHFRRIAMQTRRDVLKQLLATVPLLAASSVWLAGCGGGSDDTPAIEPIETANTRQRGSYGDLAFALDIPKLDYALDETVEWTFTVQNVGEKPVEIGGNSPIVASRFGPNGYTRYAAETPVETPQTIRLMPGEKLSRTTRVDLTDVGDQYNVYRYESGTYPILVWLRTGKVNGEEVPGYPAAFTGMVENPTIVYLSQNVNVSQM